MFNTEINGQSESERDEDGDGLSVDTSRRRFLGAASGVAAGSGLVAAGASETSRASSLDKKDGTECTFLDARTDDSALPWDTDGEYGGWGGHEFHDTEPGVENTPVVYVHGNGRDACDWLTHADYMLDEEFSGDELWSITFAEETTVHAEMRAQLESFVDNVLAYTGADQVSLVGHSLGVTGIRYWLQEEDRYGSVETVIGLAGANHGVCWCACCCDQGGSGEPCQSIAVQCTGYSDSLLTNLNEPDETPGDVEYHMVRGYWDAIYNACGAVFSPYLDGAENTLLYVDHDGARLYTKGYCYDRLSE